MFSFAKKCFFANPRPLILAIFFGFFLLLGTHRICQASDDLFPSYGCIEDNIKFWTKVYAEYPSTNGIIHDSWNLSVIYEVIDLLDEEAPGARKINRERVKEAKKKYRQILLDLVSGEGQLTPEQKRVQGLWGKRGGERELLRDAAESVRFQGCIKERFQQGLVRSGRYINAMQQIFREKGLPEDLVYLPHVESSFNYEAYSKFGAAGIWQFIRSTGRRFMTIDYIVDERRDPIIATKAAALYLQENYSKLLDWPLAITAYNYGANGMLKAKNMFGCFDRVYGEYDQNRFGFASRNFYAEFLAAREIAKNYEKYFKGLRLDPPLPVHGVIMADYYDIDDLVNYFGITVDLVKSLNPGLRKPVYSYEKYVPKGYLLHLPKNESIIALSLEIPAHLGRVSQKRSRFYRVGRGDTAGRIAKMHKVNLKELIEHNNLNRQAAIFVGQNLIIPQQGTMASTTKIIKSELSKRKPLLVAMRDSESDLPVVISQAEVEDAAAFVPRPPPGASDDMVAINYSQPAVTVDVPVKSTVTASEEEVMADNREALADVDMNRNPDAMMGNFQVEDVQEKNGQKIGYISVEAMETLGHFADWLEVKTQRIRRLNNLPFGRQIKTSQRIKIPLTKDSQEIFEERRYEFHRGIEEDFFGAYKIVGTQKYKVKYGDSLWRLCRNELEMPFWLLKKYNTTTNFEELKQNQLLIVPIIENNG